LLKILKFNNYIIIILLSYIFFSVTKKIFSFLFHIKEQNKKILALFNDKQIAPNTSAQFTLEDLPVNLPVSTQAELDSFENYLKNNQNNLSSMVNICY